VTSHAERPSVSPPLIGRDSAVAILRRLVDESRAEGRAVLIAGDAGIGKSRLVAAITPYAAEHGFLILDGACFPQDRAEPYAPLADALRTRFAGQSPEAIAAACGPFLRDLQSLLPDVMPIAAEAAPPGPDHDRRRMFAALAHALLDDAGSRPVLLVVEDLHWCDATSLDFLFYLSRRAQHRPFLLLATYRGDETTPHLRAWLAQIGRERLAEEIALGPLAPNDVAAVIETFLGSHPAVPASILDRVTALAEGNPFYLEELLASLDAEGASAGGDPADAGARWDHRLPRSLHAAVQQRVDRLSAAARHLLQLAAVAGRRFDVGLLLHLSGLDEPALLSLLDELVAKGLVTEESGERFTFRHALTRQAVYSEMLARTRALLHRRAGEAAERVYAGTLEQHAGDLADHFALAEDWEKAAAYARQAGERALRLYSSRAAIDQFTRALDANRRLSGAEQTGAAGTARHALMAAAIHRGRGRAYDLLGDFEHARADYDTAVDRARVAGDGRGECLALLATGLLWTSRDYARSGGYFRRALDLARRLDDPCLLVESLNRLGNWHANTSEPWQAPPLHREALTIARDLDDRRHLAATLDLLGVAAYLSLDFAGSMEHFAQAAALFREMDDRPALISCLTMLAVRGGSYEMPVLAADAADAAAGLRAGEEALALAQAIEAPAAEAFAASQLAGVLGPRGDYGRAFALMERGLSIAERIGHRQWMTAVHDVLGALYLDLLAPEQALPHIERARSLAGEVASVYWEQKTAGLLALAYLEMHESDRAAAVLDAVTGDDGPARSIGQWYTTYARARLALARRDPTLALRLCDRLDPRPSGDRRSSETVLSVRLRAEALAALGRSEEAAVILQRARGAMHRQGARAQLWRIHATLGQIFRTQGCAEEARREFAAARAIVEEIAAAVAEPALRETFLRNATAQLPRAYRLSPLSVTAARYGGLSARERDVATLIARGKSNGEIADALVLSKRTVETHIANIFTKLGVDSRREVVAWATRNGLTPDGSSRVA
jgi:DNA-binding CsgD family transcriptional regulator